MSERPEFWRSWRDRLSALRNVPTVLQFVWESGRAVVVLGLVARIIAALPEEREEDLCAHAVDGLPLPFDLP